VKNNNKNGQLDEKEFIKLNEQNDIEYIEYKRLQQWLGIDENKGKNYLASQVEYLKTHQRLSLNRNQPMGGKIGRGDFTIGLNKISDNNVIKNYFPNWNEQFPIMIAVECKSQEVDGSAKEKIAHCIRQLKFGRDEEFGIIVLTGEKFSQQEIEEFKFLCDKQELPEPYKAEPNKVLCMTREEYRLFRDEVIPK